ASPAVAQKGHGYGNGHGNGGKHQANVERRDRDRDHDRDDDSWEERQRREERWEREQRVQRQRSRTASRSTNGRLQRRVPPGWCIGRGNPHNTVANCGNGSSRYDRRYDPRYNGTRNTNTGTYGGYNSGSYSDWKRWHDQQCRDLARQRPLDLRWQAQVRSQCAAEDRQARASYGV
ncbi:MAG TPA: hypothetical protein VM890_00940, partial [Longimicrobium sp.]|nr:hypothetical protein [Longimicrobium sp.]